MAPVQRREFQEKVLPIIAFTTLAYPAMMAGLRVIGSYYPAFLGKAEDDWIGKDIHEILFRDSWSKSIGFSACIGCGIGTSAVLLAIGVNSISQYLNARKQEARKA